MHPIICLWVRVADSVLRADDRASSIAPGRGMCACTASNYDTLDLGAAGAIGGDGGASTSVVETVPADAAGHHDSGFVDWVEGNSATGQPLVDLWQLP